MRRSNSTTGKSFTRTNSGLILRPASIRSAADQRASATFNGTAWAKYAENQQLQQQQQQQPRWPVTDENGPLPRLGYPAYRKQSFALPYTNSLSGSDDSTEALQRTTTTPKTVTISQMKLRGLVLLIVVLVIMGIILTGIAIGLSLRGEDNSKVTYYSKMKLDKTFQPDMANVRSYAFKTMELDFCRTSREIYQTALRACSLDDLRNGSVDAFATLTFSVAELEHMVRMAGKIPTMAASERVLERQLRRSSSSQGMLAGADVMYVRKQPETMNFNVRTEHEDMRWSNDLTDPSSAEYKRKKIEYCNAVHQAFRDSFRGCRVNEFLKHEKQVDATIRLTTDDIKYRGQRLAMATSPDKLNAVVRRVLGNFKTDSSFFRGTTAPVKISVEHLLSEKSKEPTKEPTTNEPVTLVLVNDQPTTKVTTEKKWSANNMTGTSTDNEIDTTAKLSDMTYSAENGTEVTITTIIIHYNGSLNNVSGASLFNGSDAMSAVTVTLTPNITASNATAPTTTPYQPMEGVGVDMEDTNDTMVISTITIDVPLVGLGPVEGIDPTGTTTVFSFNEDELFATDEELPWCDD